MVMSVLHMYVHILICKLQSMWEQSLRPVCTENDIVCRLTQNWVVRHFVVSCKQTLSIQMPVLRFISKYELFQSCLDTK
jgi:hypothetical protein